MTSRPGPDSSGSDELSVVEEELKVLDTLDKGVMGEISALSDNSMPLGQIDSNEFALLQNKHGRLKAFRELARHCYGRAAIGVEIDDSGKSGRPFSYRITQANVGFVEKDCIVLARNSLLASELVTAQPGDERDVEIRGNEKYFSIQEVRLLDGPVSLLAPNKVPNFRTMTLRTKGLKKPRVFEDLRATLLRLVSVIRGGVLPEQRVAQQPFQAEDPTWLLSWTGIGLAESEDQSLGHEFITRTTEDQERALNEPRGLTFVEGIAGAGKTSVALGRMKFFSNFSSGVELERFGLQNASKKDFDPEGMTGFVLSHSLKGYLKETANALDLFRLPVRDFEEFRIRLSRNFQITDHFRKRKGIGHPERGTLRWLHAMDVAMARVAGAKIRANLSTGSDASVELKKRIGGLIDELLSAHYQPGADGYYLDRLCARVAGIVFDEDIRREERVAIETHRVQEQKDPERRRREQLSLEREMLRIQKKEEDRKLTPNTYAFLVGLNSSELFIEAVRSGALALVLEEAQSSESFQDDGGRFAGAFKELMECFSSDGDQPAIFEVDLTALTIFAGFIANEFDLTDSAQKLKHLFQIREHSAIFIDEVQDFSEIEIVLMGMTVASSYNQVTLAGDLCQQLHCGGARSFEGLFPWIPGSASSRSIFLDQNFRQREELATLSAGVRSVLLGDRRVDYGAKQLCPARVHKFDAKEEFGRLILRRMEGVPKNATIALIGASAKEVQLWFDLIGDDLSERHRPPIMSRRDDLVKRVNVHFTEVVETKGLEFDVVIVPDLGSFDLQSEIGRNQLYVAISRARHSLLMGCFSRSSTHMVQLKELEEAQLLRIH